MNKDLLRSLTDRTARRVYALSAQLWWLLWERRKGETWKDPATRLTWAILVALVSALALPVVKWTLLTVVFVVLGAFVWVRLVDPLPSHWWSNGRLVKALVGAKILKDDTVNLRFYGQPRSDEFGESVKVGVPGATISTLRSHHEALAGELRVSTSRLLIEQDPDDDPSKVTLTLLTKKRDTRQADVEESWSGPIIIGRDDKGGDVEFRTSGTHSAIVGTTGSGKSWLGRLIVSHALLDPTARVFAIIGKDDIIDWRAMSPVCDAYVGGTSREDLPRIVALLEQVHELAASRRDTPDAGPVVLVVEEWFAIRMAASNNSQLLKRLDSLMAELLATGRSRKIHVIMHVQRGTIDYLPGNVKANLGQRLVGTTASKAETGYVLDQVPEVLPARPGEFLLGHDGRQPKLVRVDVLDDDEFRAVCRRAAKFCEAPSATPEPVVEMNPLLVSVLEILAAGDPAGMPAEEIMEKLDPDIKRPTSPIIMGKLLGTFAEVEKAWTKLPSGTSKRVWRAVAGSGPYRSATVAARSNGDPTALPGGPQEQPLLPLQVDSGART